MDCLTQMQLREINETACDDDDGDEDGDGEDI